MTKYNFKMCVIWAVVGLLTVSALQRTAWAGGKEQLGAEHPEILAAWKGSGLPTHRVIGSGTSLDTACFRRRLAERYSVASDNVHAYIIGEHGDSQFPVLSSAQIGGASIERFCQQLGLPYDEETLARIAHETRTAAAEIISAKGATYYGIGAAIVRIVRAILRDERSIFTVSSLVPESLELGPVSLSLPTILHRGEIDRVLPIPLNASEERALRSSAKALKRYIGSLDGLKEAR